METTIFYIICFREGKCNGVVLWAEFDFGDGQIISTGPRSAIELNKHVQWDYYTRQGIHLLHNPIELGETTMNNDSRDTTHGIDINFTFRPVDGVISFKFIPK